MKKIAVKGTVIDDDSKMMYDWFDMTSIAPSDVSSVLNDGEADESVIVNVASGGGDVFAASEIYSMLKGYSGDVTVNIQGLAASAASVIAMAGDHVNISPTAHIMIHKASTYLTGNADDLSKESNTLDKIDQSIANAYVAKTGMAQNDLIKLMSDETWLTAQEAVDKGFADEIMFSDEQTPQFSNSVLKLPNHEAVNKFRNLILQDKKTKQPTDTLLQRKLAILNGKED